MKRNRNSVLATLVGMAVLAAAAIGSGPAPASVDSAQKRCGVFTGPAWKSKSYGNKGRTYQVSVEKASCTFATSWSKKLVKKPSKGAMSPLVGPAGWQCYVHPSSLDFTKNRATWGRCDKGSSVFTWFPLFG